METSVRISTEERFLRKVDKQEDGCWEWAASRNQDGYGLFNMEGTSKAHRASYLLFVGPIPEGLTIDHLCRNRGCVNPEHLEPVTLRENVLRGLTLAAANAAKSHCYRGHPLYGENLRIDQLGKRVCRECRRLIQSPSRADMPRCVVDDCGKRAQARGLCNGHYHKQRAAGKWQPVVSTNQSHSESGLVVEPVVSDKE
jgi:hypothetical protein